MRRGWLLAAFAVALIGVALAGRLWWIRSHSPSQHTATPRPRVDLNETNVELAPGLEAVYHSLAEPQVELARIDSKPAFTWDDSSPHPRLASGPFAVAWDGVLLIKETDGIRFSAHLAGRATVSVDDVTVLEGRNEDASTPLRSLISFERSPGLYRIHIDYESLPETPARFQLLWEGRTFAREPLPAVRLKHVPAELPEVIKLEESRERGRAAIERFGCARCHASVFPGISAAPPGPSLADLAQRSSQSWLVDWLADPTKVRSDARMPVLFATNRTGFVERWLVVEHLHNLTSKEGKPSVEAKGDHRLGRQAFMGLGCVACHQVPDKETATQPALDRYPLEGLGDRATEAYLAAFLADPSLRYPDGRMPKLPIEDKKARDLAAFILLWNRPSIAEKTSGDLPTREEIATVSQRLGVAPAEVGAALVREKGCLRCHPGVGDTETAALPIRNDQGGCLSTSTLPRFNLDEQTRQAVRDYLQVAALEKHPSEFARRQRLIKHLGCLRCHQRDSDRLPPLEEISRTLWSPFLSRMPYQKTPPLSHASAKYMPEYLLSAVRGGVTGVRPDWYSFRMPSFGPMAEEIVRALAEGDGELPTQPAATMTTNADPTLPTLGPTLVGAQGYSCISCHVWNGKSPNGIEPGTVGPDLVSVTARIRRDWFDRWLDDPLRIHPNTPMPAIFQKGKQAPITAILNGEVDRQKDALWAYLAQGKNAPPPTPKPAIVIDLPPDGGPVVAQIPIQTPDTKTIESITALFANQDLLLYDVNAMTLLNVYTGARILRHAANWRSYALSGTPVATSLTSNPTITLITPAGRQTPSQTTFLAYERLPNGMRVHARYTFVSGTIEAEETLTLGSGSERRLTRAFRFKELPAEASVEIRAPMPPERRIDVITESTASGGIEAGIRIARFGSKDGVAVGALRYELPAPREPAAEKVLLEPQPVPDGDLVGPLERPGYRALVYPRPKATSKEDLIMPGALAAHPRDGRIFIASMKLGELLVLRDPHDNAVDARFENFAGGLFQDAYALHAEEDALYVLQRRNLTRIPFAPDGGPARFERVALLPHSPADAYDWGYGLVRDRSGAFVMSFAPHANQKLIGSGSAVRLKGDKLEEIAFGMRNPFGWCTGPDQEVFFTDNQGEWVASNKLCHVSDGRFYGYPNPAQAEHAKKPFGKTAVWVPYDWARSINGVTYDNSGGKFGPFSGQFFLAELMHGGAVIRANVEKINGEYQGACFPFWGKGLIGPLVLTFDPKGRLFVGGITQPGWMGQPDRGALFRIDYTGAMPFEIQSIHVLPSGYRLRFTRPVERGSAGDIASYLIEHYRYEYTGAYGSPELDRNRLTISKVHIHADGMTVDLTTNPLIKDRVYAITGKGVRSAQGEALVHPTGVYTLNEIPK